MAYQTNTASRAAIEGDTRAAIAALVFPARLQRRCLPLRVQLALPPVSRTHEAYLESIRASALTRLAASPEALARVEQVRLTYGGLHAFRGITVSRAWLQGHGKVDYINISAAGEESPLQLFGTCLHELGHVLAGCRHGRAWKQACRSLGMIEASADGICYERKVFDAQAWTAYLTLPEPTDGAPRLNAVGRTALRCTTGNGARGGKSRGKGSGSRNRLWVCACAANNRIRTTRDGSKILCTLCQCVFEEK